jgi:hypothetical protein
MATHAPRSRGNEVGGWIAFAAIVLLIVGFLDVFFGLAGVLNDKVVRVGGGGGVIIADYTTWGWVHIVIGALMVLTAFGLFAQADWARWAAIWFAMLNAIAEIGVITAFPLWSLLVIALSITVIYQLTARWPAGA